MQKISMNKLTFKKYVGRNMYVRKMYVQLYRKDSKLGLGSIAPDWSGAQGGYSKKLTCMKPGSTGEQKLVN